MTPFDIVLAFSIIWVIIVFIFYKANGPNEKFDWIENILAALCLELLGIMFIILICVIIYLTFLLFKSIPWYSFFHTKIF